MTELLMRTTLRLPFSDSLRGVLLAVIYSWRLGLRVVWFGFGGKGTTTEQTTKLGFNTATLEQWDPSKDADGFGQKFGWARKGSNYFKGIMIPEDFRKYMDELTMNFDPDGAVESEELYKRWDGKFLTKEQLDKTFGERTVGINFFQRHKGTETQRGIPCGWGSKEDCDKEMQRWGDKCCVGGTLHVDIEVSFDRFTNNIEGKTKTPHDKDSCTVMSAQLNLAKNAHGAFKSKETLRLFCEEKGIDPELGKVAITRLVFEPFLKSLIRRHVELNSHRLKTPDFMKEELMGRK